MPQFHQRSRTIRSSGARYWGFREIVTLRP
jgi:hypothetical protein